MKKAMKKAKLALVLGLAVLLAVVSEGSAAEVLKLKLATYAPVGYPAVYAGQKLWVDKVNELGKGIVHVEPYWGGTLLNAKTMIPGLQDGVADWEHPQFLDENWIKRRNLSSKNHNLLKLI
jgi:TRAP-type C4-dicarboxylate transport system substrate-binding protein